LQTERIVTSIAGERMTERKANSSSPIGMFDSGVGGLTVLAEVQRQLPNESVIYFGDTARVPYGSRSAAEIIRFNLEIINFLKNEGCKMIVMACGTSSAIAYPVIRNSTKLPLQGIITPAVQAAINATKNKKIGLIATVGSVQSGAYQQVAKEIDKSIQIFANACPLFVPLIEGGFIDTDETRFIAKEYLKPLMAKKIDTLILGCTHYPHLSKVIQSIVGPSVTLINPGIETASFVKDTLERMNQLADGSRPAKYSFYVSGSPVQFQDIGSRLFGKPITGVKQIKL
jgi:glutamate racemase